MGLDRLNVEIWWQSRSGLLLGDVIKMIKTMRHYEDPPKFLILHVAGNNLGKSPVGTLRQDIKQLIYQIRELMPETQIIWSQILPRLSWRYSNNTKAMDRCRKRLNNFVATLVINMGGSYIRYPDIYPNVTFISETDGVHLTPLGNDLFLNTLQAAIETFLSSATTKTFPAILT